MKKVLILDVMMSYGHQRFNFYYLNILSQNVKLYVINDGAYYNDLDCDNVELINCHEKIRTKRPSLIRKNMIATFKKIKRSGVLKEIDAIIVMGYDTLTFPVFFWTCHPDMPIYTVQHHNIDETQNKIKKMVFDIYKNRMTHIVLDENFVTMLKEECGVTSNIEYLPHFLSREGVCDEALDRSEYICALSNSNDEEKIRQLVELDRQNFLRELNLKIFAKSNCIEYDSANLKIMKGYIPEEVYSDCFKKAKAILVLFPDTYRIRFSGTLLEALVNYKLVIGYHIPIVSIYKEKYSNNVLEFDTFDEFKKMLQQIRFVNFSEKERDRIVNNHSGKMIEECMRRMFDNYEFTNKKGQDKG